MKRVEVHGHRGARAVLPENTIPGFLHAIEAGADAIELDVLVTRDDVPVVCHDPVLRRALCVGPSRLRTVRSLTARELRQWDCGALPNPRFPRQHPIPGTAIPTLEEVLSLAERGRFDFTIEAKLFRYRPGWTPPPERFAELLVQRIRARGLEPRVILQSFDFRVLEAVRRMTTGIRLAALDQFGLKGFVALARRAGVEIVAPARRTVTRRRVSLAHAAGVKVMPWTANTHAEWDRLINAGVDGIITDDPTGLIEHLKRRGLR
ncbi:MAG: glycerophosphodiester phosphodiesterase [Acidobacteria bacterium]|nr:glycerophosphodiester phosphodiesterase [Acidobacteriota bacterium]